MTVSLWTTGDGEHETPTRKPSDHDEFRISNACLNYNKKAEADGFLAVLFKLGGEEITLNIEHKYLSSVLCERLNPTANELIWRYHSGIRTYKSIID